MMMATAPDPNVSLILRLSILGGRRRNRRTASEVPGRRFRKAAASLPFQTPSARKAARRRSLRCRVIDLSVRPMEPFQGGATMHHGLAVGRSQDGLLE